MFILKKPMMIHGKQYQPLDTLPEHLLPMNRIQTLINIGSVARVSESEITDCERCEKKFIKKTHNQKYCSKMCRKAN